MFFMLDTIKPIEAVLFLLFSPSAFKMFMGRQVWQMMKIYRCSFVLEKPNEGSATKFESGFSEFSDEDLEDASRVR